MKGPLPVIVVGGGVAGIAAATALADAGRSVVLVEQRKLIGGRAGSFRHAMGVQVLDHPGMIPAGQGPQGLLDNSQHVLLGCCAQLQQLYRRLGVSHLIRFERAIRFADTRGRQATMQASQLPSPLHLGPSLATFGLLTFEQKSQIARAMAHMLVATPQARDAVEGESFAAYLRSAGQSDQTIRDFWDVICISALNEPCLHASAKYGLQVFQDGFLGPRHGYTLGYATVPLSLLYTQIPGVDVRVGQQVLALAFDGTRVRGVRMVNGQELPASHVILATSAPPALFMLEPALHLDPRLKSMAKIQYRAILGAHLLYDRPVPIPSPVAMVGTSMQWAFVDTHRPELIHGVVSAADLLPLDADLPHLFDAELRQVFPAMNSAKLLDAVVVRETRATFRPLPGAEVYRPTQSTHIPGLTLAGDYTRTNWPATMEGAARSGQLAADIVCESLG